MQPVNEKLPPNYERLGSGKIGIRVTIGKRIVRRTTGFSDLKSAIRAGEKMRRDLLERRMGIGKPAPIPTVSAWYPEYLANYCGRARGGKKRDPHAGSKAKAFVDHYGQLLLSEVDSDLCQRWITRREQTISRAGRLFRPDSIRTECLVIKAMFEAAVPKYLAVNPWKGKNVTIPRGIPRKRILSPSAQWQLLDALEDNDRRAVLFLLNTGMRRAELLGFRPCDLQGDRLHVRAETAKGGKARIVPATEEVIAIITEQRHARGLAISASESLWTYDYPEQLWKIVAATLKRLGLPHVSLHDLRRTFGTRIGNENQMPPKMLQRILGHASLGPTMEHYVSDDDERMVAYLQRADLGVTPPAEVVSLAAVSRKA